MTSGGASTSTSFASGPRKADAVTPVARRLVAAPAGAILVVAISGDLAESVPLDRLAAGGTLVLAVGRSALPERVRALTESLSVGGSATIAPAGAAGFDIDPNDPARADVARLIVARRQ